MLHRRFSRLWLGVFALMALGAVFFAGSAPANAVLVITYSAGPGSGAPPATLGGYTMTAFPTEDSRGNDVQVTDVASPLGGVVSFGDTAEIRQVGPGWGTDWSHGYTGDVYCLASIGGCGTATPGTVVLTLPANTAAFYFYVEPNAVAAEDVTATAGAATSGAVSINPQLSGPDGAKFFGFYATGGTLSTITITNASGNGMAIGEFAIALLPTCTTTNICYVNAITGDDANDGLTPATALATIQEGIDRTTTGGRVIVAPGSYPEDVVIGHGVSLEGPNIGKRGDDLTRTAEADINAAGSLRVDSTADVVIDGFQVTDADGPPPVPPGPISSAVLISLSERVTFQNSRVINTPVASAVIVEFSDDVRVLRNLIGGAPGLGSAGMFLRVNAFVEISDNTITAWGGASYPIAMGAIEDVVIQRNLITGSTCNCIGISVDDTDTALIAENEVHGSSTGNGDTLWVTGNPPGPTTIRNNVLVPGSAAGMAIFIGGSTAGVTIRHNDLDGPGEAIVRNVSLGAAPPLNAEQNWYGSASGPNFEGTGPGTGNEIEDLGTPNNIDFDPWLCRGDDLSPAIGFQPATGSVHYLSPCDTTKPVWSVRYERHNNGAYNTVLAPWSNKIVHMLLSCTDGGPAPVSGVHLKQGDLSTTFTDGVWTQANLAGTNWLEGSFKGDAAGEDCFDRALNEADAIELLPAGQTVRVDTVRPVCSPSSSTVYVNKNQGGQSVNVGVKGTDVTSGINYGASSITIQASNGASYTTAAFGNAVLHPTDLRALVGGISMPNNTKGQLKVNVHLVDFAGNVSDCSFLIKAR